MPFELDGGKKKKKPSREKKKEQERLKIRSGPTRPCPICRGSGNVLLLFRCRNCQGLGRVPR